VNELLPWYMTDIRHRPEQSRPIVRHLPLARCEYVRHLRALMISAKHDNASECHNSKKRKDLTMTISYRLALASVASMAVGAAVVTELRAQVKPPVYVVIDISEMADAAAFAKAASVASLQELVSVGGRYLVRSTKPVALDGSAPPSRFVLIAFDNEAQVTAWRNLPSTKEVTDIRLKVTKSRSFEVEGLAN
jgi:uncharacterized protein (DUF1330 family)